MKTIKTLFTILSLSIFMINIIIAIDNKNFHDTCGWFCTLVLSISILINKQNEK